MKVSFQLQNLKRWVADSVWIPIFIQFAVAGLGLVAITFGSVMTYKTHFEHPKYSYLPTDEIWQETLGKYVEQVKKLEMEGSAASPSAVFIEVSGAVEKPGVYSLSQQSRVQDAVLSAGGFQVNASKAFIHQELNLAEKIKDQQKLYVPFEGESVQQERAVVQDAEADSTPIFINSATQKQLESLDGIGEKRAEKVISGAPYSDFQDFQKRSGLSEELSQKMKGIIMF